jgi:hypothetical protein
MYSILNFIFILFYFLLQTDKLFQNGGENKKKKTRKDIHG